MAFVCLFNCAEQSIRLLELPELEATISTVRSATQVALKAMNLYIYNTITKYMILAGLILYAATGGGPNEVNIDGQGPLPEQAVTALGLDKLWDWLYRQSTRWKTKPRPQQMNKNLRRRSNKFQGTSTPLRLFVAAVVVYSASSPQTRYTKEDAPFNTDSSSIGIDNRCSACITHVRSDIPGELQRCMIPMPHQGLWR